MLEQFMNGLDTHRPNWFVMFANETELRDCVMACTDGASGTVKAKTRLREAVACRLVAVLDAACNVGIVNIT